MPTAQRIAFLRGHQDAVVCLTVTPDSQLVASGAEVRCYVRLLCASLEAVVCEGKVGGGAPLFVTGCTCDTRTCYRTSTVFS